ncbi:hypothetical protein ABZ319_11705 [Nocardia sp. NPDC005978]|uniref:hypothetical protein n=1 Tax=Nocardia sp. NPDC005978 TaxID=3156725 RepID=UPI0033BE5549
MIDAGSHLAVPRKLNGAGWRVLTTVLGSGLTFHGGCCGQGPGYRPRTLFEVRERLNLAERRGIPVAVALAMEDTAVAGS